MGSILLRSQDDHIRQSRLSESRSQGWTQSNRGCLLSLYVPHSKLDSMGRDLLQDAMIL